MSEAASEEAASEQGDTSKDEAEQPDPAKDETDWKAEARKWEARAKENSGAAKAAEKARLAAMSEADRAVAEAETRGRTAAKTEYGARLARTSFDALAGRRNKEFDTAAALEYVDLGKFVGDDGEPDDTAIKAAVERLVPAPPDGTPNFDGGTRTPPPATQGMSQMIRAAAGRA
jgi:hypothetical protein